MSIDPNDLQAQINQLEQRRQMAQAMAQQNFAPQQQQVVNGRIMDQGLAPAIRGIAGILSGIKDKKLASQELDLQQQQNSAVKQQKLAAQDNANAALQDILAPPVPTDQPQQPQSVPQPAPDSVGAMFAKPQISSLGPMGNAPNALTMGAPPRPSQPDPNAQIIKITSAMQNGTIAPEVGKALLARAEKDNTPAADYTMGDTRYSGKTNQPIATNPSSGSLPALVQEYEYAKNQGFKGSLVDFKKQTTGGGAAAAFGTPEGDLQASLAIQGVSLPAGLRSKEQQHSLLTGLIRKYPDMSTDEIATQIHNGQISFGAEKKETTTAAALAGKTAIGENELVDFIPKALEANAAVPRGSFVPFNKLTQMGEKNISDPKLKALYGRTQAILNAYDIVAARGGTDQDKRAHNRQMLETADSPETYAVAANVMADEANIAQKAAHKAERSFSQRTADTANPPETAAQRAKRLGL